jgi:hypothetical protein
LEPLTTDSTRAVSQVVTHTGICRVKRYALELPQACLYTFDKSE